MRKIVIIGLLLCATLWAAPPPALTGQVSGGGVPVPGAAVSATQDSTVKRTTTDANGGYSFPALAPGAWTVKVAMPGFKTATGAATVSATGATLNLTLTIAPPTAGAAATVSGARQGWGPAAATAGTAGSAAGRPGVAAAIAVNGSMQNAASSTYALPPAFGNHRPGGRGMYNGGIGFIFDSSALDARPFSLTGQNLSSPSYGNFTGTLTFGGPLLIPHLFNLNNAPMVTVAFERESNRTLKTAPALVPTATQRAGDLSGVSTPIVDPATGNPFPNNQVPVSAAAQSLLDLFPLPNQPSAASGFNYQTALAGRQTRTSLQLRVSRFFSPSNQVAGTFNEQDEHATQPNLFGFNDQQATLGVNTGLTWRHRFSVYFNSTFTLKYSRQAARLTPFFAGQTNVSSVAGIQGNDQAPGNWGPPTLQFATGLATLNDAEASDNRKQTLGLSWAGYWNHADHNFDFGADVDWLQFNDLQQANGRGRFRFTGAASGNDWADFLLGVPDGASLVNGNADKYLRQRTYDAFISDDWRVSDGLTLDLGARWEYQAPVTELYNRLANILVAPNFGTAATVVGTAPVGTINGAHYPSSLLRPYRWEVEPRLGLAWRPLAGSSLLVRAGYGIYQNTSVYPALALRLAEQAPFATSLNLANSAATPLTLATAFLTPAGATPDVFGIDPNFRPGIVQTWTASVQEDLPADLALTLSYLGSRGTHAAQEILPNTYPAGGVNPCPTCPAGFTYLASNGTSSDESGTAQLQRRFAGGLAALGSVTWAHAIDDAGLGGQGQSGAFVAQDWRNPQAERGRSSFDQRVTAKLTVQYSTGANRLGGALLRGWEGTAVRGWTLTAQLNAGSGLPLTPATSLLVPGTSNAVIRPAVTGVAVTTAVAGRHLDPAAYTLPAAGAWGNAGRNSINGPRQFSLNAGLQRSFQLTGRWTANLRVDATNVLNHVTYPAWNTLVGSSQFGLPQAANTMRTLKTTLRFTF